MIGAVTRRDLVERVPRTTPEALRESPGVFVQQTNPGGGSPIIRGLVGPQNLIVVDGVAGLVIINPSEETLIEFEVRTSAATTPTAPSGTAMRITNGWTSDSNCDAITT